MKTMPDFQTMKPREIEAYLREVVRKTFGDEVENTAEIYARSGYYTVSLMLESGRYVKFDHFRRTEVPKIAKALRAMK